MLSDINNLTALSSHNISQFLFKMFIIIIVVAPSAPYVVCPRADYVCSYLVILIILYFVNVCHT